MDEPLIRDFDHAARDLFIQINNINLNSRHFLIYGHSLGAYLALRGYIGPGIREQLQYHTLEKDEFVKALRKKGGLPDELVENKEVFEFFEPIIRADFELLEKKTFWKEQIIQAPIHALMGSEEEFANSISNWKNYTMSDFSYEILEGDHFFIYKNARKCSKINRFKT